MFPIIDLTQLNINDFLFYITKKKEKRRYTACIIYNGNNFNSWKYRCIVKIFSEIYFKIMVLIEKWNTKYWSDFKSKKKKLYQF